MNFKVKRVLEVEIGYKLVNIETGDEVIVNVREKTLEDVITDIGDGWISLANVSSLIPISSIAEIYPKSKKKYEKSEEKQCYKKEEFTNEENRCNVCGYPMTSTGQCVNLSCPTNRIY